MSVKLMSQAWDLNIPTGQKMLLLALCDHANDEGVCYPSQEKLSNKCSMSCRAIISHLKWLQTHGFLHRERRQKNGVRLSNLYYITLENAQKITQKPSENSAHAKSAHADSSPTKVKITSLLGADSSGAIEEEPSVNHQYEPSVYNAQHVARTAPPHFDDAQPTPEIMFPDEPDKPKLNKRQSKHAQSLALLAEFGITGELANDYIDHRNAKRSTVSATVLRHTQAEATKCNLTLAQALIEQLAQNWQGFKAEWILNRQGQSAPRTINTVHQHTNGGFQPW